MSLRSRLSQMRQSPRVIKTLLFQQFMEGCVPIAALYAIMFEKTGGLDLQQIGLLFSVWSLAYLAAELPSGVLADFWSRKQVIAMGGILRAAGFAIWLVWPTFTGYLIGFALWGIAIACTSGAVAAFLHSELRAHGKDGQFAKYYGWLMAAFYSGVLSGYGMAALLTLKHAPLLIIVSMVLSLGFGLLMLFTQESPYKKQATYIKTLVAATMEVKGSRLLQYICVVLFAVYMVIGVLEELLPRLYAGFGLSDSGVSVALAVSLLATIVLVTRLEAFVRFSLAKQALLMAAALGLLIAGLILGGIGAVLLILLFDLVFQLFRPVFMHHIQEASEGDQRATIASVPGLAAGFFSAAAYFVIGQVAHGTSERFSIGLYAGFWLAVAIVLAIAGRSFVLRRKSFSPVEEVAVLYNKDKP
jgi:MFS family permease